MPMYDFVCDKCKKEFEKLLLGTETIICPHCGSNDTERKSVPSNVSVHFRGKGFYSTENRKKEDRKNIY